MNPIIYLDFTAHLMFSPPILFFFFLIIVIYLLKAGIAGSSLTHAAVSASISLTFLQGVLFPFADECDPVKSSHLALPVIFHHVPTLLGILILPIIWALDFCCCCFPRSNFQLTSRHFSLLPLFLKLYGTLHL